MATPQKDITEKIVVGITGASGALYGIRLVEALLEEPTREVHLIMTPVAGQVLADETDLRPRLSPFDPHSMFNISEEQAGRIVLHNNKTSVPARPAAPFCIAV